MGGQVPVFSSAVALMCIAIAAVGWIVPQVAPTCTWPILALIAGAVPVAAAFWPGSRLTGDHAGMAGVIGAGVAGFGLLAGGATQAMILGAAVTAERERVSARSGPDWRPFQPFCS